ncbi:epoxide hydrolase [Streptomyces gardneri]|uniref:epoxide hydrolase family protein n=1 Tax=Nocardia TaxID=1817 RepID=UPI001895D538|nr:MULTISPECIES: epoxide hydrolase N-terminal domain-containing protein [Nocardia]MBF6168703.1 epoxide hydrolase [Streptomyces gardneri]MBF6208644.1 epoxide hydrolase [Streptomyces gardneri]
MNAIHPFRVEVPQADLDDLRDRLNRARWTPALPGADWSRGVPVDYLRELVAYWAGEFDWRQAESELNRWPQFTTEIDGQIIHFKHIRSARPGARALLLLHDNPGGVMGLLDVLEPLSRDFHLVVPFMPGFGFSTPLADTGWTVPRTATAMAELMTRLGYERFGAHGGGGGANLSLELGRQIPERLIGLHVNAYVAMPDESAGDFTDTEKQRMATIDAFMRDGIGFNIIMSTRPQTIAHGLNDSPIGLLAWVVEKFKEWSDPQAELPEHTVPKDRMLLDASVQWFTGTSGSIAQSYHDLAHDPMTWAPKERVTVPTAFVVAAGDVTVRRFADRDTTVARWTEFDKAGAYIALEQPTLLVEDMRVFFANR